MILTPEGRELEAILLDDDGIAVVNEVLCKGCGICAAGCLSGAVIMEHSTDEQVLANIEGILL